MLTASQVNEITRVSKKSNPKKPRKKQRYDRRKGESEARRMRAQRKIDLSEKLTEDARRIGKVTPGGKRICMNPGCSTILSVYNYEECCSRHQAEWNVAKSKEREV